MIATNEAMFNLGVLYVLAQCVSDPLRSALLEQIFRIQESFNDKGGNGMHVSIKTDDGARIDAKNFDLYAALEEADANETMWLKVPVEGGTKLINFDHIVSVTVKDDN